MSKLREIKPQQTATANMLDLVNTLRVKVESGELSYIVAIVAPLSPYESTKVHVAGDIGQTELAGHLFRAAVREAMDD